MGHLNTLLKLLLCACLWMGGSAWAADEGMAIVVIGHANLPRTDLATLERLYTGRASEIGGIKVEVVNAPSGSPVRDRFLSQVLGQDDERYVGYWTVRRHIGKGIPPRVLGNAAEVISFVQATPGGVGYIAATDLRPGLNVIFKP